MLMAEIPNNHGLDSEPSAVGARNQPVVGYPGGIMRKLGTCANRNELMKVTVWLIPSL